MLYQPSNIDAITVTENDMLHFCSVDLVDSPMKQAHKALINKVKSASGTIIFDPNVRLPLWTSEEECKNAIREFLPLAHVLKISDEELTFVTGNKVEKEAIAWLFQGSVEAVIYTKGKEGAEIHFKDGTVIDHSGYKVKAIDTTGAGDAFIGALINRLAVSDIDNPIAALKVQGENILEFSNIVAAKVTTKYGAIESIPNLNEVNEVLEH